MTTETDPRQSTLLRKISVLRDDKSLDQEHLRAMLSLLEAPFSALSRDCFEPGHFTASAFVLSPDRKNLLLIRHAKLGIWLQPGGHIESADLDTLAAARREVQEETGLKRVEVLREVFDVDVHRIPAWKETPAHQHFDIRVLLVAQEIEIEAGDDAAEARWFTLEEVAQATEELADGIPTDRSVRKCAERLLTLHDM